MTEFLCLGGPLHAQTIDVPVPENGITIRPSAAEELLRPADAPPVVTTRYVLRGVTATISDDKQYVRPVMALEQLLPQQLMMALADALVTTWIQEGQEVGQATGADSGGMPGAEGRGGDTSPGDGIAGPRSPLL